MSTFHFLYRWLLMAIPIKLAPASTLQLRNLSGAPFCVISLLIVVSPPPQIPKLPSSHYKKYCTTKSAKLLFVFFFVLRHNSLHTIFPSKICIYQLKCSSGSMTLNPLGSLTMMHLYYIQKYPTYHNLDGKSGIHVLSPDKRWILKLVTATYTE